MAAARQQEIIQKKLKAFHALEKDSASLAPAFSYLDSIYPNATQKVSGEEGNVQVLARIRKNLKSDAELQRISVMKEYLTALKPLKTQVETLSSSFYDVKSNLKDLDSMVSLPKDKSLEDLKIYIANVKDETNRRKQEHSILEKETNNGNNKYGNDSDFLSEHERIAVVSGKFDLGMNSDVNVNFMEALNKLEFLKNNLKTRMKDDLTSQALKKYEDLSRLHNDVSNRIFVSFTQENNLPPGSSVLSLKPARISNFVKFLIKFLLNQGIFHDIVEEIIIEQRAFGIHSKLATFAKYEAAYSKFGMDILDPLKLLLDSLKQTAVSEQELLESLLTIEDPSKVLNSILSRPLVDRELSLIFKRVQRSASNRANVSESFKVAIWLKYFSNHFADVRQCYWSDLLLKKALPEFNGLLNATLPKLSLQNSEAISEPKPTEDCIQLINQLVEMLNFCSETRKSFDPSGDLAINLEGPVSLDVIIGKFVSLIMKSSPSFAKAASEKYSNNHLKAAYRINCLNLLQESIKGFSETTLFVESLIQEIDKTCEYFANSLAAKFLSFVSNLSSWKEALNNLHVKLPVDVVNFIDSSRWRQTIKNLIRSDLNRKYSELYSTAIISTLPAGGDYYTPGDVIKLLESI